MPPNSSSPLLGMTASTNDGVPNQQQQRPSAKIPLARIAYWTVGTALAVWFLGIHAPPYIRKHEADSLFYIHLVGAYGLYLACIHNSMITPSLQRHLHVWMGRMGMVMGIVGFVFGAILALGRFIYIDPTFAIAITSGGIFQLMAQFFGYRSIRRYQQIKARLEDGSVTEDDDKEALKAEQHTCLQFHIGNMAGLFFSACGIPAMIRLSSVPTGEDSIVLILIGIGILNFLGLAMAATFRKKNE
eukprot:CAMPEP_0198114198 /NCGR_PEP_ID=MMETSP1442-20131203/5651_1 /TAXON_ID= /ORGANISM="Craspedostauros australis, Strain CCMP3328" /LENGTH=243 /DNA_ID=CAMNT_0043771457 /DNA_START=328 /DNA_END=1059 /DNA_ORIENTATION=-